MANYRLKANGNTSLLATWQDDSTGVYIDSTVLPSVNDTIYSNNFVGQIDANLTVDRISNRAATGVTAGGRFEIPNSVTVVAVTHDVAVSAGAAIGAIQVTGSGLVVNIMIASSTNTSEGGNTVNFAVTGTSNVINYIGNMVAGGATGSVAVRLVGGNTFNHNGSILAGTASATYGIFITAACTLSLNGNYTAGNAVCIANAGISTISINGTLTASSSSHAITMTQGTLTFSGQANNVNGVQAIDCRGRFNLHPTIPTSFTYQTTSGNRTCFDIPTSDVRQGVLSGTLAVPPPATVSLGVPTDNTVGTYSTTPALIVTELLTRLLSSSDFNTSGSIGKLLKDNIDAAVSSRLAATAGAEITAIKAITDTLTDVATETTAQQIITDLGNINIDTQAISDNVWADEPERLKNVATVESTGDQIATI